MGSVQYGEQTLLVVHASSCSGSFQEHMPSILRNIISPTEWDSTVRPLNHVLRRGQRFKIAAVILLLIFIAWWLLNISCAEEPNTMLSPNGLFTRCYGSPILPIPFALFNIAALIVTSYYRRRRIREIIRDLNGTTWKGCLGYKHHRRLLIIYLEELRIALSVARRHSPLNAPVKDARMNSLSPVHVKVVSPIIPEANIFFNKTRPSGSSASDFPKDHRLQYVQRTDTNYSSTTRLESVGSYYTAPRERLNNDSRLRISSECTPIDFEYDEVESTQAPRNVQTSRTEIEQPGTQISFTAQSEDGSWRAQIT